LVARFAPPRPGSTVVSYIEQQATRETMRTLMKRFGSEDDSDSTQTA